MSQAYLFVYGTLRKGFSLSVPEVIAADIEWLGYSRVQGRLYDIGKYPGAVPDDSDDMFIEGELLRITDPVKVFRFLDNYEGFDDANLAGSEYCRRKQVFTLAEGQTVEAWIYWYNYDVTGKKRIAENDYIKYLQKNQLV